MGVTSAQWGEDFAVGITVSFDLTPEQVQELLKATGGRGPFAGWRQRLMDKAIASLSPRVAGPTTLELSEAGLRISTTAGLREVAWAEVAHVIERRYAWVLQLRPSGVSMVPMAAIAPDERVAFANQLRAWAGSKYKVREGGMVAPSEMLGDFTGESS